MLWNNTKEIKSCLHDIREWMVTISCRMAELETKYDCVLQEQEELDSKILRSLDKADDCLKNVEKLNSMINELKGCVSLARGALEDRKKAADAENQTAVLAGLTREIHKSMMAFIQAGEKLEQKGHFTINQTHRYVQDIYLKLCDLEEKKSPKKKKTAKKRAASQAPLSERV